jgi:uncharacterized GH25 family protein
MGIKHWHGPEQEGWSTFSTTLANGKRSLNMDFPRSSLIAAFLMLSGSSASAHEFWLEPTDFTPKLGQSVAISIYIGQKFKGNSYPYLREEFKKFVAVTARGEKPVKGVPGDDPAVMFKFTEPGLVIFAHYSTPEKLNFDDWGLFQAYLNFEGLEHILPLHEQLGKPRSGIKEIYSRCAKLLMSVGPTSGDDRLTGMPLELLAERNPYQLREGNELPVRVFLNGKPLAGIAVSAISKSDPESRQLVRTDGEGRARIPLLKAGPWLLNAVHMMEPAPGAQAHWMSLWASMVFARP